MKEFNFKPLWLITVLTQDIIEKRNIADLVDFFGIKFKNANWKNEISGNDMGNVLISDIGEEPLISAVDNTLKINYPDKLSFKQSKNIYSNLSQRNLNDLSRIYVNISQNQKLKELVEEAILQDKYPNEFNKKSIIGFIFNEFYKLKKIDVEKILQNFLIN